MKKINRYKKVICFVTTALFFVFSSTLVKSQTGYVPTKDDLKALEGIIVEKYHVATDSEVKDTTSGKLAKGSVTYRIFVDLKPEYKLEMVYGSKRHPLTIETTTYFFNDVVYGQSTGDNISEKALNKGNVLLDSWISMGAAAMMHHGVLLKDDTDGSILKKGKDFEKVDGLYSGDVFGTAFNNLNVSFFKDSINNKKFYIDNGAWANLAWAIGPTTKNTILIAQLTTDGDLSFEINIQVGTPSKGTLRFIATENKESDEKKNKPFTEVYNKTLSYKSKK